ncbi:hypothetical protein [Sedimentitalea sp.]|uniref:hypothetical protein n=1 Tax=Sedimentitalea sp. TaxID=2048915 RepID=UPI003298F168
MNRAALMTAIDSIENTTAEDAQIVLSAMLREVSPDILVLGLDPDDGTALRYAVAQGHESAALAYACAIRRAMTGLRYNEREGDCDFLRSTADAWLASRRPIDASDATVRAELGTLSRTRAEKATLAIKQRGQQSGNTRRRGAASLRQVAAWQVFGLRASEGASLLRRLRQATEAQLAALSSVYEFSDVGAFLAAAADFNSGTRKHLKRDNRR